MPDSTPVEAEGWRVAEIPDEVFPGLVKGEGIAQGLLLTDLTSAEWQTIDAFEDPVYELMQLTLTNGQRGWAYVCIDDSDVSSTTWNPSAFARNDLQRYVERCIAWRQRYEERRG